MSAPIMIVRMKSRREKKRVSRLGREVHLGPTEFRLLEFLMENPGRVYTHEQLLDGVWGRDIAVGDYWIIRLRG